MTAGVVFGSVFGALFAVSCACAFYRYRRARNSRTGGELSQLELVRVSQDGGPTTGGGNGFVWREWYPLIDQTTGRMRSQTFIAAATAMVVILCQYSNIVLTKIDRTGAQTAGVNWDSVGVTVIQSLMLPILLFLTLFGTSWRATGVTRILCEGLCCASVASHAAISVAIGTLDANFDASKFSLEWNGGAGLSYMVLLVLWILIGLESLSLVKAMIKPDGRKDRAANIRAKVEDKLSRLYSSASSEDKDGPDCDPDKDRVVGEEVLDEKQGAGGRWCENALLKIQGGWHMLTRWWEDWSRHCFSKGRHNRVMGCFPSLHVACGTIFIILLLSIIVYAVQGGMVASSRQMDKLAASMSTQAENLPKLADQIVNQTRTTTQNVAEANSKFDQAQATLTNVYNALNATPGVNQTLMASMLSGLNVLDEVGPILDRTESISNEFQSIVENNRGVATRAQDLLKKSSDGLYDTADKMVSTGITALVISLLVVFVKLALFTQRMNKRVSQFRTGKEAHITDDEDNAAVKASANLVDIPLFTPYFVFSILAAFVIIFAVLWFVSFLLALQAVQQLIQGSLATVSLLLALWLGRIALAGLVARLTSDGGLHVQRNWKMAWEVYYAVFLMYTYLTSIFIVVSRLAVVMPLLLLQIFDIDCTVLPKNLRFLDSVHSAYKSIVVLTAEKQNAIVPLAARTLAQGARRGPSVDAEEKGGRSRDWGAKAIRPRRLRHKWGSERKVRLLDSSSINHSDMGELQPVSIQPIAEEENRKRRARTRWHLAYTLIKLPQLRECRKRPAGEDAKRAQRSQDGSLPSARRKSKGGTPARRRRRPPPAPPDDASSSRDVDEKREHVRV